MTKMSIKIIALLTASLLSMGCIATDGETDDFDNICAEGECDLEPQGAGLQDDKLIEQEKQLTEPSQCHLIKASWLCARASGCKWEWDRCIDE